MNLSTHNKSQIDLKVAQELRNNQQFIYQTNQSLQDLRNGLKELASQKDHYFQQYQSLIKELQISYENFTNTMLVRMHENERRVSGYENVLNQFTKECTKKIEVINQNYVEKLDFQGIIQGIEEEKEELKTKVKVLFDSVFSSLKSIESKICSQICDLRQELLSSMPSLDPIRKEYEERINTVYVDFRGLITEIERCKKTLAYDEKKFENIYTLIERLKAGK